MMNSMFSLYKDISFMMDNINSYSRLFFASTFWRKLQNPKNAKLWIVYIGGYTPKPL
jgi:hypothetical protein